MPKRTVPLVPQHRRQRVRRPRAAAERPADPALADHVYGVPTPTGLYEAIEHERENLGKAESLLSCMAIAMEHGNDDDTAPYYPDIADLARQLVRSSLNGLDSLSLQRVLLRNKIKEPPLPGSLPASQPTVNVELVRMSANAFAKAKPVRPLHRWLYSARHFAGRPPHHDPAAGAARHLGGQSDGSRRTLPRPAVIRGATGTNRIDRPGRSTRALAQTRLETA